MAMLAVAVNGWVIYLNEASQFNGGKSDVFQYMGSEEPFDVAFMFRHPNGSDDVGWI
jgi:hypothetical protein